MPDGMSPIMILSIGYTILAQVLQPADPDGAERSRGSAVEIWVLRCQVTALP